MEIAEKVIIITGSGSGIGRAMAVAFGREGARVACCGRRTAPLEETVDLIAREGGQAISVPVDVIQAEQVQSAAEAVVNKWGGIDVLVNNAARFGALGALWEVDWQQWETDVEVNLKGPVHFCRAVLPTMIAQGAGMIVNITAQAGTDAKPGCSAYGCSKAALIHLTNTLASELAMKRLPILVFGLNPGFNRTEMTAGLGQMPEIDFWIPGLKSGLESASGQEPDLVAATAVELVRYGVQGMSGRIFRVGMTADYIEEHAREIEANDLLTLRFRHLP